MTRATLLPAALVAAVAAAGAVWLLLPAPVDDEVLAPLRAAARALAVDAGAPGPLGVERGARLAGSFTAEASVDLGPPLPAAAGREALVREAAVLSVPAGGLRVAVLDAEATVDRRLLLAGAVVTLRATSADGREVWGERSYELALRQRDGAWLVHDVRPAGSGAGRP